MYRLFHRCNMDWGQCCYLGILKDFNTHAAVPEFDRNTFLWRFEWPFCYEFTIKYSLVSNYSCVVVLCAADVGGFVQDPDPELLVRWYQAGALQPFFRGHSANITKRREPWLFGDDVTSAIRLAIQQRYRLLPYWYTLFQQAHTSALPPIR